MKKAICTIASYIASIIATPFTIIGLLVYLLVADTDQEPPLNDGELAALRALGAELNPAQIAADAEYMAGEMLEGLREPAEAEDTDEEVVANGCTVNNDPKRCRCDSGINLKSGFSHPSIGKTLG